MHPSTAERRDLPQRRRDAEKTSILQRISREDAKTQSLTRFSSRRAFPAGENGWRTDSTTGVRAIRRIASLQALAVILVLGLPASRSRAEENGPSEAGAVNQTRAASAVEPAPGGGEMMVLGPERQYVIEAQITRERGLDVGCRREQARSAPESDR